MTEETLKKAIYLSGKKEFLKKAISSIEARGVITIAYLRIDADSGIYDDTREHLESYFKGLMEQVDKSISDL